MLFDIDFDEIVIQFFLFFDWKFQQKVTFAHRITLSVITIFAFPSIEFAISSTIVAMEVMNKIAVSNQVISNLKSNGNETKKFFRRKLCSILAKIIQWEELFFVEFPFLYFAWKMIKLFSMFSCWLNRNLKENNVFKLFRVDQH